jgi:hypothetical protein
MQVQVGCRCRLVHHLQQGWGWMILAQPPLLLDYGLVTPPLLCWGWGWVMHLQVGCRYRLVHHFHQGRAG